VDPETGPQAAPYVVEPKRSRLKAVLFVRGIRQRELSTHGRKPTMNDDATPRRKRRVEVRGG